MVALVKQYGSERILVNSAADWGVSDPLKVPKTANALRGGRRRGGDAIETICWQNPVRFFAQSGRFDPAEVGAPLGVDQTALWQGNSVLRGQTPRRDGT